MTAKTSNPTGHFFSRKQAATSQNRSTASEILASDLAAFEEGGGVIEKLGNTHTLKFIGGSAPTGPVAPPPRRR